MKQIIELRQWLHRYPELSGAEFETAEKIVSFVGQYDPSDIMRIGRTGLAVVFDSQRTGKTTVIRAELDALPIVEQSELDYRSIVNGVAHLCGHDGHMAILAGLAQRLHQHPPQKGKVVLLFQPAEETGQGAHAVITDPAFQQIKPDYLFALHNVPGFEKGTVLIKDDVFSVASKGMTIQLFGRTSHAAEPEKGISPARAVADLILAFETISQKGLEQVNDKLLATVVHVQLGEIAFGTSPGYAELRVTLRTPTNAGLDALTEWAEQMVSNIAEGNALKTAISYCEYFPATVNDVLCNDVIRHAARNAGCQQEELAKPFKWSEDFGFFTQHYAGGLFGLGSGVDQPPLHHPGYDFPDELMETGINLFEEIIKIINK